MKASKDIRNERGETVLRQMSPFAGEPKTFFVRNQQAEVMGVVTPHVLRPEDARLADNLGDFAPFALAGLGLAVVAMFNPSNVLPWVIALITPLPFAKLFQSGLRRLMRTTTKLAFTAEHFVVEDCRGKTYLFNRQEPHRFRLDHRHEAAREEAEKNEIAETKARMRGRVIRKKKYQSDTFHLMLDYCGYPHFVMEIMGIEDAKRVLARVKQVDEKMDRIALMGSMGESGPQSEWDDMAGAIPEKV